MSLPFAETLVSWFNERPQSGNDSLQAMIMTR